MNPHAAQAPAAEKSMLGACLLSPAARDVMCAVLVPEDFYVPAHRRIAEAICHMHTVGLHVDTVTVAGWISDHYGRQALEDSGGLPGLLALVVDVPSTSHAPTYAARIKDRAGRRQLLALYTEMRKRLDNPADDIEDIKADVRRRMEDISAGVGREIKADTVEELLAAQATYRWLVPNLLERQDRLIITGAEGRGKSTLLRQLAVQFVAGIHPFTRETFEPLTVLLLDLENSKPQVARHMHVLLRSVERHTQLVMGVTPGPAFDPDRLFIEVRPDGIDLGRRTDRGWLTEIVDSCRPDVLIGGPLYKMIGPDHEEETAAVFAEHIDVLRRHYDMAVIFEAHSPHASEGRGRTLRPIGPSLWMRWVDFGYGFRPAEDGPGWDWVPWKGPRDDQRQWPSRIRKGRTWPWINANLADADDPPF